MKNFYEILEINENASKEVIEKVYKVLAKKHHPDLQRTSEERKIAEEKMKEINEAYSILSDTEKRKKYDMELNSKKNENNMQENKNQEQSVVNSQMVNDKLNKKMKKQQKKIEKKLVRKMQDEYLKSYGDYLRKKGYKVKYRVDFRKLPILIAIIVILIIIGWLLWLFPVTHNYLVDFYNKNIIIQKILKIFFSSKI